MKTATARQPEETRRKLVEAASHLIRQQGFHATTVDQICGAAGVTKGSFFHHFDAKETIGREAMGAFARGGMDLYADAFADPDEDPLEQLYRLLDIMAGFATRSEDPVVCMVGMMSQETALTNPAMREACAGHLLAWTEMAARLLAEAKRRQPSAVDFDPESVAWMLNSLWQGSMLIGKTRQEPELIVRNLRHARDYVDSLFSCSPTNNHRQQPT